MNFKESKSIYLQIVDRICDEILLGKYQEETRIPGVRDYAAQVGVNVNTVVRSFSHLESVGVLYTRRGLGYFVAPGASDRILQFRRKEFLEEELPEMFRRMRLLDISWDELSNYYHMQPAKNE